MDEPRFYGHGAGGRCHAPLDEQDAILAERFAAGLEYSAERDVFRVEERVARVLVQRTERCLNLEQCRCKTAERGG